MFPENVRLFIDGKDVTSWVFGHDTITPTDTKFSWNNIDITQFVRTKGTHIIEITAESGVGRVEVIVEME
jgi:hypothetical protein